MKQTFFIIAWMLTSHVFISQQQGVNLRGQVRTIDPVSRSSVPLPKITVDLYNTEPVSGRWLLIAASSTDENGFYYFNRIAPGNYFIQLNKHRNYDIRVTTIDERKQTFLDLPVLNY